jgi:hypothetical protein
MNSYREESLFIMSRPAVILSPCREIRVFKAALLQIRNASSVFHIDMMSKYDTHVARRNFNELQSQIQVTVHEIAKKLSQAKSLLDRKGTESNRRGPSQDKLD